MKAATFHGRKEIVIGEVPEPTLRPGAVAIDVAWCGICGTDLHEYLEGPISIAYAGDHPATIELVRTGQVDLRPFITARIALDDLVEQGIHALIDHKDNAVKILVHP